MPRTGYSQRGGFSFAWRGDAVLREINRASLRGTERAAKEAERVWRDVVHVVTGRLRDSAYFVVEPDARGRITLVIGNDAPYAIYEELGNAFRPGHYPIRQTVDIIAPLLPGLIQAEVQRTFGGRR